MAKRVSKSALAALLVLITAAVFAIFPLSNVRAETAQMCGERLIVIDDLDNCLTEEQELELAYALNEAARSAGCSIGIVITSDLNGKSDKQYADDFSDEHFGVGSDAVVLLLFNSYNKPEYANETDYISTSGKMKNKLDKYIDVMFNSIYDKMGETKGDPFTYNESTGTYGGYDFKAGCEQFASSITLYAGSFSLDDDVDPGFSGSTLTQSGANAFAGWISELIRGIFRMLGGLRFGC
ncbi:MAG: TPM domain-containing protein [Oscillospiraceae bacterium]|nr:TPM domain-containing protein [Oscillospiraceae bacterium]